VLACLVLAAGAAAADPTPPAPSAGPSAGAAKALPWLEVKLPAAPVRGTPTAKAELRLRRGDRLVPADYAGLRVAVGSTPPKLVAAGDKIELTVAADPTAPLRFEIAGVQMLAHLRPGDRLSVQSGHDGGWTAIIANRTPEAAPASLTICGKKADECPTGYASTYAYRGDRVCPVPGGESYTFKCVKAAVVRARGPIAGRAEVGDASESGRFDDLETVSLAPGPLAANAFGPWVGVSIGHDAMPLVRLGDATARVVLGAGDACQVWLDAQGRVESALR
jgi:hypothetical protein